MEVNEKEREEALVYSWLECFVCLRIEWPTGTQNLIQPVCSTKSRNDKSINPITKQSSLLSFLPFQSSPETNVYTLHPSSNPTL